MRRLLKSSIFLALLVLLVVVGLLYAGYRYLSTSTTGAGWLEQWGVTGGPGTTYTATTERAAARDATNAQASSVSDVSSYLKGFGRDVKDQFSEWLS